MLPRTIDSFRGQFRFLSNFYILPNSLLWAEPDRICNLIPYPSTEHAYQAAKTLDDASREVIAGAKTPGQAKRLGRTVTLRDDWEEVKLEIMSSIVTEKFRQNHLLRAGLLATTGSELIEGNTWGDQYWGICRGVGQNHLGKILMHVRELMTVETIHALS